MCFNNNMCAKSSRVLQCSPSPEFQNRSNCSKCKSDHRFTLVYIVRVLSLSMKAKCENKMKWDSFLAQTGSGDSMSERPVHYRKPGHMRSWEGPPLDTGRSKDGQSQERHRNCPRVNTAASCRHGSTFTPRGFWDIAFISGQSSLGDGGTASEGGLFLKPRQLEQQGCPRGPLDRSQGRIWQGCCRRRVHWVRGTAQKSCEFNSNNDSAWISEIHLFVS